MRLQRSALVTTMRALALLGMVTMPGWGCAMEASDIEEILEVHRAEIMQMPGVTGVGMSRCEGEPCIKVYAEEPRSDLHQRLDRLLGDTRYVVEVSGEFMARPQAGR